MPTDPLQTGDPLLDGLLAAGEQLPFNRLLGVRIRAFAPGEATTELPDDARLDNHLGGVHAIAVLAPVELAGALAVLGRLRPVLERGYVPVLAGITASYRAPGRGTLSATSRVGADVLDEAERSLAAGERVRVQADVEVTDAAAEVLLRAELTFAFLAAAEVAGSTLGGAGRSWPGDRATGNRGEESPDSTGQGAG